MTIEIQPFFIGVIIVPSSKDLSWDVHPQLRLRLLQSFKMSGEFFLPFCKNIITIRLGSFSKSGFPSPKGEFEDMLPIYMSMVVKQEEN